AGTGSARWRRSRVRYMWNCAGGRGTSRRRWVSSRGLRQNQRGHREHAESCNEQSLHEALLKADGVIVTERDARRQGLRRCHTLFTIRGSTLLPWHEISFHRTHVDLARPGDFLLGVAQQLLPVREPSRRARDRKQHRKEVLR